MLKAMIVDDDRVVCQGLSGLIPWNELGFQLIGCAYNGDEGYRMALESEPDVVISDLVMPIVDGTDLCRRIMDTMSRTSFILISAYEDFAAAQMGMTKAVQAYIVKPITREKLNTICDCLKQIRQKSERRDFFRHILFSDGFEEEMDRMLESNDEEGVQSLFEKFSSEGMKSVDDSGTIQDVCLRLVRILFRFLEKKSVNDEHSNSYEEAVRHVESMKFKADMILYVSELYREMCREIPQKDDIASAVMSDIRNYIDMHYSDANLNCAYLSRIFHYSSSYISRMFSAVYQISPANYILQTRVKAACYMLSCEDKQISQIAEESGFGNANYFAKVFRAKMKMSPSKYRMLHYGKGKSL